MREHEGQPVVFYSAHDARSLSTCTLGNVISDKGCMVSVFVDDELFIGNEPVLM